MMIMIIKRIIGSCRFFIHAVDDTEIIRCSPPLRRNYYVLYCNKSYKSKISSEMLTLADGSSFCIHFNRCLRSLDQISECGDIVIVDALCSYCKTTEALARSLDLQIILISLSSSNQMK